LLIELIAIRVLPIFSRRVDSAIAGPEETKDLAGNVPPPDSNPFEDTKSGENYAR